MPSPVGELKKVEELPVGKLTKTSLKSELELIVNDKIALREAEKPPEPVESDIRVTPQGSDLPPVESKPELLREDVVELIKENHPDIDELVAKIIQKLPPLGGGNSWTVADMPGYRKAQAGNVFGVLNGKAGFYDPSLLHIVSGGEDVPYTRLVDTADPYMYVGEANPGTAEAAASWRIKRIEFLTGANDGDIEIKWANGASTFDRVWTNRASETYS